jgi:hypothetical protein
MRVPVVLGRLAESLPDGVELTVLPAHGTALLADRGGVRELAGDPDLLRFIDDGQRARYLIGDAATSAERPANATVKVGVVRPHTAFTPHAHGAEHVVLSLGYASCGMHDPATDRLVDVPLRPGWMVRIPPMLPHSFGNRAGHPLLILAANTGTGLDHPDYAITAAEAERRARTPVAVGAGQTGAAAGGGVDFAALAITLRRLERSPGPMPLGARDRVAAALRRLAGRLERT